MAAEFRFGHYIREGITVYKHNFFPLFVGGLLGMVPGIQSNTITQIQRYRATGQAIEISGLFDFDNIANKWLSSILGTFLIIPAFSMVLLAERPGMSFVDSWKAGFAFGKTNIVGMILLALVGMVAMVGLIGCCVGVIFTLPLIFPILTIAYEDHKDAVVAAATEAGIELPDAIDYSTEVGTSSVSTDKDSAPPSP
jgi:hypothetical protein